jgi:acyl-coenzyme A thioesterase PaaI-like protein
MEYMDVFHKAVTQTLRSNFDRPTGDPKGERVARIIPLGSTKQVKKPCLWVRLFYCFLISDLSNLG